MLHSKIDSVNSIPSQNQISSLIDEFVKLHEDYKAFEGKLKRYEELKKILSAKASEHDVSEEVRFAGQYGFVCFSKPSSTRSLSDLTGYLDAVGLQAFINSVSVSVQAADKLLNSAQKAALFTQSIGSRRLKDCGRLSSILLGSTLSVVK